MTKSTTLTQQKSDYKRGLRVKGLKLPIAVIQDFEQLAKASGKTQGAFFAHLLEVYKSQKDL